MGPAALERMNERLDAIEAALIAAMPSRTIKREMLPFDDHGSAELSAGVLMLISQGEGNYSSELGMVAKQGTQKLLLIGHLELAPTATGQEVEAAEITFIEELKSMLRAGVPGLSFNLINVEHSAQLEKPYGWFVASVDAGPPKENTY